MYPRKLLLSDTVDTSMAVEISEIVDISEIVEKSEIVEIQGVPRELSKVICF